MTSDASTGAIAVGLRTVGVLTVVLGALLLSGAIDVVDLITPGGLGHRRR
jgi:hypothetical protein